MARFGLYLTFVFLSAIGAAAAGWALGLYLWQESESAAPIASTVAGVYVFFFTAFHVTLRPTARDLGAFLLRFVMLHTVALGVPFGVAFIADAVAPNLPEWARWLAFGLAFIASAFGCYALLFDASAVGTWERGIRLVQFRTARDRANAARGTADAGLSWGGVRLPSETATSHFLCLGTTRSGKTLTLRMLMQDALTAIQPGSDHRALVYDAKQDMLPMLAGMGLTCEIVNLNPFDKRCAAWDIAADVTSPAAAYQVASIFIPPETNSSQPFFSEAARNLFAGAMISLMQESPGSWDLRDVLQILGSPASLRSVLGATPETRHQLMYLHEARTAMDIMATIDTKTGPLRPVAATWQRAETKLRLREWLDGEFIVALSGDETSRASIDALNRVIFQRATELILSEDDSATRRTWVFLDEARAAGKLELHTLMNKGGSKGAAVVLAGQDTEGLRDVYGDARSRELLAQASHKAIFRLESPEAAKWASDLVGHYDAVELHTSDSWGYGPGGTTRTIAFAEQYVKREAVLPAQFMSLPLTNRANGLTGYYLSPVTGVFRSTLSAEELDHRLSPPDVLVKGIEPRPESDQYLGEWGDADWTRLGLTKPPDPPASGPVKRGSNAPKRREPRTQDL